MQTLQGPEVLEQPFCAEGDKNTIPSAATGSQLASLEEGFPEVTQKPIEEGGIPPEREDFNGALNLMSQFYYAFQNGWLPTFDEDVSEAIGGYAEGAVLWYAPTTGTYANKVIPLRSTISNNTYNFNLNSSYIGTYWVVSDPASNLPPHVFTSDNVIAGTDIEINRIIDPYVLNEDTVACFHFNGDTNNAVDTGVTLSDDFKAAITGYTDPLVNPWYPGKSAAIWAPANSVRNVPLFAEDFTTFGTLEDYTLEFFVTGNTNIEIAITATNSAHDTTDMYPRVATRYPGYISGYAVRGTAGAGAQVETDRFPFGTFSHVAIVRKNQVASIYVNGNLVSQAANSINFANFLVQPQYDGQAFSIAEMVFSKVAKWDGNFTPPTAPYHQQEGGNQYEIKSTVINKNATNCLTEVPQRINLELNNGTLTLKAGSKVYVPNGVNSFSDVTIASDLTATPTATGKNLLFTNADGSVLMWRAVTSTSSGTSDPGTTGTTYYDTSTNLITAHNSGGDVQASFPIAEFTGDSNNVVTSIDQAFNGFGYVGSTVFLFPGIKGLIPDGRNADGTLKNIEYVQESFYTNTLTGTKSYVFHSGAGSAHESTTFVSQETEPTENYTLWYRPSVNRMYRKSGTGVIVSCNDFIYALGETVSDAIISYSPKSVFDFSALPNTPHIIETYHNGASWYRIWSDGWCEQGGDLELGTYSYTFKKPYASSPKVFIQKYTTNTSVGENASIVTLGAPPTTTGFTCVSNSVSSTFWAGGYWEAKGYIF